MRITQSETYRNFSFDLQTLSDTYSSVGRQVSSGKRLSQLSDSPGDSADLLSLTDLASDIEHYRSSANAVSYSLGMADSTLNEVNNLLTSLYTKGSQAASGVMGEDARATISTDIRALRDQILSLANRQVNGVYIFAGSLATEQPFTIDGDSIDYAGDENINTVGVDEGLDVKPGVPGSEAFGTAFSAVENLLAAIDSNDVSAIGTALGQFASAFSALGQARGKIGANMTVVADAKARLDSRETSMKEQRSRLEDTNMAEAAVQMGQAANALEASISAGGSVLQQRNLFDILG